ncbi:GuaB1 family IMP dehydrogenase-related protein [Cutibacterium acnes]|uniref:GuaB1 family IMP dehydrogenase-related protein n=1 Tax=Cutibacterium acnes TaxID=1747 RepID=UPI0001F09FDB|nr:GuaB1 family IMP dehydrogenase-related protein [Cutibacterium acnes]EFT12268.1 IMP dehydrogenase family protein [Cutibacterium acnes HL037PA1]MBU5179309.1 GuaB1 family IMP dehydrogenase-related protein [Cutibacterium acnes]
MTWDNGYVRFLNEQPNYDLTYNDVFMAPNRSSVGSRMNVDLTSTDGLGTPLPLVVANMTAISGRRMAETIARRGGIAVLPQDIPADFVARSIRRVKDAHTRFDTPVTVNPTTTVGEAMNLLNKRAHGVVLVVEDHRPVGLVAPIEAEGVDRFAQCHEVMTTDLTLVGPQASPDDVFQTLAERHQKVAVAVDEDGVLVGIMTSRGALRTEIYRPAVDPDGHLMIGTAIGINGNVAERARNALESGSDVLVMDTAHGHQDQMIRAIEIADEARTAFETKTGRRVSIVAGNIVTRSGTLDLLEAGADIIKVGVGPGAMCTTRMQTGVGRPQFSAVLECAEAAAEVDGAVWADGGVRHPRDVALALAAGAGSVMIGSWFAGTHESTGAMLIDHDGRMYKESFGMASARAVRHRTRERSAFERARAALFEEGISQSKMYLDPQRPGVEDLVDFITSGVRSSCTYAGAANLTEFHEKAVIGVQSPSGYEEGRPLQRSWT